MINKKLKNKQKNNNNLLNILFKSKTFYGESIKKTNKTLFPYIYGIRHKYTIINLKYLLLMLKRNFKLIQLTLKKKKKILIIANSNDINFLINQQFIKNNPNIFFFNKIWINGYLTNKTINFLFKSKKIDLILLLKNSVNETYLNKEVFNLSIPVMSILNTNQNLSQINYPIITNTKNIHSLFTLLFLLRKTF
jgi:ribosomal protein S2